MTEKVSLPKTSKKKNEGQRKNKKAKAKRRNYVLHLVICNHYWTDAQAFDKEIFFFKVLIMRFEAFMIEGNDPKKKKILFSV